MLEQDTLALTANPTLDAVIWVSVFLVAGYFARRPAHGFIRLLFAELRRLLRLLARYCAHTGYHVRAWTRSVLIAQARQQARRTADWHVERLGKELSVEFAGLAALQQRLHEQLSLLEADYRSGRTLPPEVPGWPRLVEHLGPDLAAADPSIKRTLEDLRDGLEMQRADLLDAYRRASRRRYLALHRTMPQWRRASRALEEITRRIDRLRERADQVMDSVSHYERLHEEPHLRTGLLAGASLWRFTLSAGLLAMAGFGFLVLGSLLAIPFNDLLGSVPIAAGLPGLGFATTVLILLALALLGLVMLESCRVTGLLPGIASLDASSRRWLFLLALAVAVMLTAGCAGVALAHGGVAPVGPAEPAGDALAAAVQTAVLVLLPFALMFVALPLAGVMRQGHIAAGLALALALQLLMLLCRLLARLATFVSSVLIQCYDLVIFLPLWVEEATRQRYWRARPAPMIVHSQLPSPAHEATESPRQTGS